MTLWGTASNPMEQATIALLESLEAGLRAMRSNRQLREELEELQAKYDALLDSSIKGSLDTTGNMVKLLVDLGRERVDKS